VRNPKVFLFDEPLSNLDAKLRVQMRAELKDIHARLTTTTVYVTHDQIEAMTMADRIVVMRDGIVEQVGEPLELFDRPANLFVASFIGSPAMNFLSGKIASDGGAPYFLTGNGTRLPLDPSAAARAGTGPVTYGIRPEHLAIAPEGEGFPAEIAVLEPTGSETHIVARLGSDQLIALLRQRIAARPGEILHFQAQPGTSHLFDSETGLRIN
jgi:multiple sugar transport system ATP-binding protein